MNLFGLEQAYNKILVPFPYAPIYFKFQYVITLGKK